MNTLNLAAALLVVLAAGVTVGKGPTRPPSPAADPKQEARDAVLPPEEFGDGRFIDRGAYVEDTRTGLLWQKDGSGAGKRNYYQAAEYAKKLKLGGLEGWRVPTREELAGIFPAITPPWQNTKYTEQMCCGGGREYPSYWTSDLDRRLNDYAYVYHWYAKGGANNCTASANFVYVRCVHDPVRK